MPRTRKRGRSPAEEGVDSDSWDVGSDDGADEDLSEEDVDAAPRGRGRSRGRRRAATSRGRGRGRCGRGRGREAQDAKMEGERAFAEAQ